MIRRKQCAPPLYYAAHELPQPSRASFYARLEAAVKDWERLAAPLRAAFCAGWGRPTDPVVYLKIFLVGYFENITYDTDLAERIEDSLAVRHFLGYTLLESTPDHSTISETRARLANCCEIAQVLEAAVAECLSQGLVSGEEAGVDSTLLPANASLSSLKSLRTGKRVAEYFQEVRERNQAAPEGTGPERLKVSNKEFRSTTDPQARLAQKRGTPRGLYYRGTHVTDGKHQIILAAEVTLADGGEPEAAQEPLRRARAVLEAQGQHLGTVVADAGYDAADFHGFVEQDLKAKPLTNYVPDTTDKPEGFRKASFAYEAPGDGYRCPAGAWLGRQRSREKGRETVYAAAPGVCAECPHRGSCLGKGRRRIIVRQQHEASRERNLARCHTEEGRAALRRRRHLVEPPFGHAKTYGGLGRLNCRGQAKVRVKVVLAAVAWNLIKLVKAVCPVAARRRKPALAPAPARHRRGPFPLRWSPRFVGYRRLSR